MKDVEAHDALRRMAENILNNDENERLADDAVGSVLSVQNNEQRLPLFTLT